MRATLVSVVLMLSPMSLLLSADDPVFSGPQVGEKLVPFEARVVFGEAAGSKVQVEVFPKEKDNKVDANVLIVFVHKVTRPSIALTRLVLNYAATSAKEGLQSKLIFLSKDPTDTEALLRRARHALPPTVDPLISVDGQDGPGAYGLNRDMILTVLVAKNGTVTANFPLIQPSVQADAPKIGHAIVKVLGGNDAPSLKEMGFQGARMQPRMANKDNQPRTTPEQDAIYRSKIAPVIRAATKEDVVAAANHVEQFAAENDWFRQRVHNASNLIVNGGKLSNYGNETAQEYLKKWAKEFAPAETSESKSAEPSPPKENESIAPSATDSKNTTSQKK